MTGVHKESEEDHENVLEVLTEEVVGKVTNTTNFVRAVFANTGDEFHVTAK